MTTNEPSPQEWAAALTDRTVTNPALADMDKKMAEADITAMRARLREAVNACTDLAMDQAVLILENHRLQRKLKEAGKPTRPHLHAADHGPGTWTPQPNADGDLSLSEAVGQALGAASMCWIGGTGSLQFDDANAGRVYDGLMAYLADWGDQIRREANEATAEKILAKERWR